MLDDRALLKHALRREACFDAVVMGQYRLMLTTTPLMSEIPPRAMRSGGQSSVASPKIHPRSVVEDGSMSLAP